MIPALGIICDVVATLAGVRQANRGLIYAGIGAFAVLSVGAWAQPYFYPKAQDELVFAGMAVLIVLPGPDAARRLGHHPALGQARAQEPARPWAWSPACCCCSPPSPAPLYVITPLELREHRRPTAPAMYALVIGGGPHRRPSPGSCTGRPR